MGGCIQGVSRQTQYIIRRQAITLRMYACFRLIRFSSTAEFDWIGGRWLAEGDWRVLCCFVPWHRPNRVAWRLTIVAPDRHKAIGAVSLSRPRPMPWRKRHWRCCRMDACRPSTSPASISASGMKVPRKTSFQATRSMSLRDGYVVWNYCVGMLFILLLLLVFVLFV